MNFDAIWYLIAENRNLKKLKNVAFTDMRHTSADMHIRNPKRV